MADEVSSISLDEEPQEKTKCLTWGQIWPQMFFLIFGICNAVVTKVAFICEAEGLPQWGYHKFQKPWFLTTITFFAMFCALPLYVVYSLIQHKRGNTSLKLVHHLTVKEFFEFFAPAFADAFEGIVSAVCIVFVGVSIDSMMKSGTLVGVSLISRWIFKQHYHVWQWMSIFGVVISLSMVGASGIISAEDSTTITTSKLWVGVIIVLKFVSQVGYAVKISYEEYFVQRKGYHPIMICGVEGFWSFVMCAFICMPIAQYLPGTEGNGIREDTLDTFAQIRNEPLLLILVFIVWFLGITYNCVSTTLIGRTSAVVRTLMEAFRTFLIWMVQFMLFYSLSKSEDLYKFRMAGEEWSTGSYWQLGGFILMTISLLGYNGVPRCPCFNYGPVNVKKSSEEELAGDSDSSSMSQATRDYTESKTGDLSGINDPNDSGSSSLAFEESRYEEEEADAI